MTVDATSPGGRVDRMAPSNMVTINSACRSAVGKSGLRQ